jgi:hypothetical protein
MPNTWIVAACPLCGTKRRYLPSHILKRRVLVRLFTVGCDRNHIVS